MPASPFGMGQHQLAYEGVGEVAARVHHHDIARFGNVERLVDHKIVAGSGLHGDCGASQDAAGMEGAQAAAACRHAGHHVTHVGDRKTAEAIDRLLVDLASTLQNPKACHCLILPVVRTLAGQCRFDAPCFAPPGAGLNWTFVLEWRFKIEIIHGKASGK